MVSHLASPQVDDSAAAYGHCAGLNHLGYVHKRHIRGGHYRKPLAAEKFLQFFIPCFLYALGYKSVFFWFAWLASGLLPGVAASTADYSGGYAVFVVDLPIMYVFDKRLLSMVISYMQ
jgi:hypothetical protein